MEERYVIGQVRAVYDGEEKVFDVYDDGGVILPNGERMTVDESVLTTLRAEYNNAKSAANEGAKGLNINVGRRETKAYETLKKTEKTLAKTENTNEAVLEQVKIINHNTKRNIGLAIGIAIAAFLAIGVIVYMNWAQIKGQVTGEYNIAVVNTDISAGDTIEDAELSYKTVTVDEYNTLCGSHFVDSDGTMTQDTPIFFVDRGSEIVNKFAATDMKAGDIVMASSVSSQSASQDMYVVDTQNKNGNHQQQTIDGSELSGDTTIEYYARITTSSGESYEVPLSSIKLRDKTVEDVLNEQGSSILTGSSGDSNG